MCIEPKIKKKNIITTIQIISYNKWNGIYTNFTFGNLKEAPKKKKSKNYIFKGFYEEKTTRKHLPCNFHLINCMKQIVFIIIDTLCLYMIQGESKLCVISLEA